MPDTGFVVPLLWQSALLPFLVALAVLAAVGKAGATGAAAPAAVAAGVLASFAAALGGQWSPAPKVALDWLPWIVLAAAVLAVAIEAASAAATRGAARAVVALGACALTVWPAAASLELAQVVLVAIVAAALIVLTWTAQARGGLGGPVQPLLLAVIAGGAGLALLVDSSQSVGRLAGALGCALLGCALLARRWPFTPSAAGLAVLVLGVLLLNAYVYAGFPLHYLALLFVALLAAPVVGALARSRGTSGSPVGRNALAAVLATLPVAIVVVLAVKAMQDAGGY
ncbi:hypothetical protein [Ramlibacter rhizophilus]|uniref:Uncharacterized protein n=1 Tax=Ramlibacter rhizophilus TaxID=1781167 RepID=A0A4Z0C2U0_9BURK|nr:hypothetical protein [Ramlibacter rhizophilus]TFZ04535.1 hypothetical protein EZ242_01940 [Ramlibacter rhizophilus]